MRVLIAGAGALGSVFGGFLRRAGLAVTLLGRRGHLAAIARDGLYITGLWGDHRVAGFDLCESASQLAAPFDAVLLAVKSYDSRTVAEQAAPLLAPSGVVISLQNGLGNLEAIESVVTPARTLGARVIFGAEITQPGCVRVTVYADQVLIGARRPGVYPLLDQAAQQWAARIDAAGIPAADSSDIDAALWAKVFYNAALNPLGALLGVPYGALAAHAETRALMDAIIGEAFAVAQAEGVGLPWASADEYRQLFYGRLVPSTVDHRSSMLQDLERGRRTEIDAINGEIWRRGQAHGIVTPYSETLTRIVRCREQQR
ncbi:MAG: ketopantoate reductase family protein [Deltaproteobacteria bacterium]|nr:ketopantoate reductase family protein [Deltaproteobacteria bacterium]